MVVLTTVCETETYSLGKFIGQNLFPGARLSLEGPLGAGKTAMVRGIAAGLGIESGVKSPTFTLMQIYDGRLQVLHFDLYRLTGEDDLEGIGWDEFTTGAGVALVEWGDKFIESFPEPYMRVKICPAEGDLRNISFIVVGKGKEYLCLLEELKKYAAGN